MKILSTILITIATIATAIAEPIRNIEQIPTVDNRQRTFLIENGSIDTVLMIEHYLDLASQLLDGDALIIITDDDVYDGFYNDFYDRNEFDAYRGIVLCHNKKTDEFHIFCHGDMGEYEEYVNERINNYIDEEWDDTEQSNYLVYNYFALHVVYDFVLGDDAENLPDTANLPENDWGKYLIANRTHEEPLIGKQFILDNLTEEKIEHALSTPYVDTAVKVYDAANLLTDAQYDTVQYYVKEFVNTYNVDMAIVTLNRNCKQGEYDNNPAEVYAMDFFEYNDFGKGKPTADGYDGVILLIDMHNRIFSILDVGKPNKYGVASRHYDKYIDEMAPWLTDGNYYYAMLYFIFEYEDDYLYESSFPWGKCSLFALWTGLVIFLVERHKYKTIRAATSAANYVVPDSFKLSVKSDRFVSTHTTKRYSPKSSSSGGGHRSSSGRSFGGGSGRF